MDVFWIYQKLLSDCCRAVVEKQRSQEEKPKPPAKKPEKRKRRVQGEDEEEAEVEEEILQIPGSCKHIPGPSISPLFIALQWSCLLLRRR